MAYLNIHKTTLSGTAPQWDALYKFAVLTASGNTAVTITGAENPDAGVLHFINNSYTLSINGTAIAVNATGLTRVDWAFDGQYWSYHTNVQGGTSGEAAITPAAPTGGTVDDAADTFTFTLNPSYAASEHEYSLNGASYVACSSNVISVGNVAVAIGDLKVRVKAATGRNASADLTNATAFTTAATPAVYSLSGADQNITVANATDLDFAHGQPFSIGFRGKVATGGNGIVLGKGDGTQRAYVASITPSTSLGMGMAIFDAGGSNYINVFSYGMYAYDTWFKVLCTYDGSGLPSGVKIYINGSLDVSGADGAASIASLNASGSFRIGKPGGYQSSGTQLDDVFVADRVLTAAEALEWHNDGATKDVSTCSFYADVLALWKFDMNLQDSKGTHHGTATTPQYV
jgi:hypothetical protein